MRANQAAFAVHTMCRVLGVSASGFYAWRRRAPSKHALQDTAMRERIRAIHAASDATYGMPRVRAELLEQGVAISRRRVARLMREAHLCGVSRRRGFVTTARRANRSSDRSSCRRICRWPMRRTSIGSLQEPLRLFTRLQQPMGVRLQAMGRN